RARKGRRAQDCFGAVAVARTVPQTVPTLASLASAGRCCEIVVIENTTAGVDHRRPGAFRRLLLYPPELRARDYHNNLDRARCRSIATASHALARPAETRRLSAFVRSRHESQRASGGHMRGLVQQVALIAGFLLIHRAAPAQQSTPGPVTTAFPADAEPLSRNLLAAADDTPPMTSQFKPTPAPTSLAEVVSPV